MAALSISRAPSFRRPRLSKTFSPSAGRRRASNHYSKSDSITPRLRNCRPRASVDMSILSGSRMRWRLRCSLYVTRPNDVRPDWREHRMGAAGETKKLREAKNTVWLQSVACRHSLRKKSTACIKLLMFQRTPYATTRRRLSLLSCIPLPRSAVPVLPCPNLRSDAHPVFLDKPTCPPEAAAAAGRHKLTFSRRHRLRQLAV